MACTRERESRHTTVVDLTALAELDEHIDPLILGEPIGYDLNEVAEATGWTAKEIAEILMWAGLPIDQFVGKPYMQADVDGLASLKQLADKEGLSWEAVGTLTRSVAYSMERLALSQVEAMVHHLAKKGYSDTQARAMAAEFTPLQNQAILDQINILWRRHFAGAVHRLTTMTILNRGVSDEDTQLPLLCAVGYAKVANFTEKTAKFGVRDYTKFAHSFHDRVADVIHQAGGRVVKSMGNFVIWVASHPDISAEIALNLADAFESDPDIELQVAMTWCRVMSIRGDIYGPGVNLVSILADAAPVGEVLIDEPARYQLARSPRFSITPQPAFDIKGLGAIHPALLRAAGDTRPLPSSVSA